jgi:transcriptional regulator with XRE-family HTH domain
MSDPLDAHIGAKIRAKRLELGFGQSDFASLVGLELSRLSQAERGIERLGPVQIAAVCKLLGTQVSWLYEDAPEVGTERNLHAHPRVVYSGNSPDRHELLDNFDRLPTAQQEQLVKFSRQLVTQSSAKSGRPG